MTRINELAMDKNALNYICELKRAETVRQREFVKQTTSGPSGTSVRKLREAVPLGAKHQRRPLLSRSEANLQLLPSFEFQIRNWLGLHERGLSRENSATVLRNNALVFAIGLVLFIGIGGGIKSLMQAQCTQSQIMNQSQPDQPSANEPGPAVTLSANTKTEDEQPILQIDPTSDTEPFYEQNGRQIPWQ